MSKLFVLSVITFLVFTMGWMVNHAYVTYNVGKHLLSCDYHTVKRYDGKTLVIGHITDKTTIVREK